MDFIRALLFLLVLLLLLGDTSTASARSQRALPDPNRKCRIAVGTTGPQHTTEKLFDESGSESTNKFDEVWGLHFNTDGVTEHLLFESDLAREVLGLQFCVQSCHGAPASCGGCSYRCGGCGTSAGHDLDWDGGSHAQRCCSCLAL